MVERKPYLRWPKDNGMDISEGEWELAVTYLVKHITLQTWAQIQQAIRDKGPKWYLGEGQRLGRAVKYLLTRGGFRWGAVCMQANWFRLLEEGAKRVFFVEIELCDT